MAWVMNTERRGPDIIVRIGAVKVANIHIMAGKRAYLRFMDSDPEVEQFESVSAALKRMHAHLNSPPLDIDQ